MNDVRYRLVVTGLVQGVWYRESCRVEAERLGVRGWVRNLPGGEVEVAVEGEPAAVARLVEWCRRGPPLAEVARVEALEETARGEQGFRVRR